MFCLPMKQKKNEYVPNIVGYATTYNRYYAPASEYIKLSSKIRPKVIVGLRDGCHVRQESYLRCNVILTGFTNIPCI